MASASTPTPFDASPSRWALDGHAAFVPAGGGRFLVRSPEARAVEASAYQAQLLLAFGEAASPDEVLARYPFEAAESRAFLERCREAGLLRRAPDGPGPEAPERVPANPSFAGAPPFLPSEPAAFTFLGVPFDGHTTGHPGARFGPSAIRAASEGLRVTADPSTGALVGFHDFAAGRDLLAGVTLADAGDVYVRPGEDGPELLARITDVVRDLVDAGTLPLIAGGDHSITAGVLAAYPDAPLQIVHLDAHTDLGGVEVADGTGLHHGNVFSVVLDSLPHVTALRQVGLRGWIEASSAPPVARASAVGIDRLRAQGVSAALDGLDPSCATYVSVDIDVVDPAFAPSTGTPVPGGLFPHELKAILREVGRRFPVVGADVVEVARPHGPHDGTAGLAMEALLTLAGGICDRILDARPTSESEP